MSNQRTPETTTPRNFAHIEARQRANGCNQDNEPDDWGRPCCGRCICADEAAGRKSHADECREMGLL